MLQFMDFLEPMGPHFTADERAQFCISDDDLHALARMASATGFTAIITYASVKIFELAATDQSFLATFPKFSVIVAISLLSYVGISRLLSLSEADPVISKAKSIIFGQVKSKGI